MAAGSIVFKTVSYYIKQCLLWQGLYALKGHEKDATEQLCVNDDKYLKKHPLSSFRYLHWIFH